MTEKDYLVLLNQFINLYLQLRDISGELKEEGWPYPIGISPSTLMDDLPFIQLYKTDKDLDGLGFKEEPSWAGDDEHRLLEAIYDYASPYRLEHQPIRLIYLEDKEADDHDAGTDTAGD